MKIIYPNNVSFVYSDGVAEGYTLDALTDGHTKGLTLFNSSGATVVVSVLGGAGMLTVHNTNADSITATAYQGGYGMGITLATGWTLQSGWTVVAPTAFDIDTSTDSLTGSTGDYYFDFADQTDDCFVIVQFSNSDGNDIYLGEICCGPVFSYRDPGYGITERISDYGINNPLPAGGRIYSKRNVARAFSIDLLEDRQIDTFEMLHEIALNLGGGATGFIIADKNVSNYQWVVFGYFSQPIQATHAYPDHSIITIDIEESV